ncbi:MAG: hypothetical protein NXI15_11820 [Gammaproteobacteria bacterium]|jgi:hypothetical protein|nr:hypothetical protein [Gammaproteobacteria bacterium]
MLKKELFIALLVSSTALLTACSGGEGDDVTINIDAGPTTPPVVPPPVVPPPGGDCDLVQEADFVSFNADCSVGTLSGTIDSDYTLASGVEWRLDGVVQVGEGNGTVNSDADVQALRDAGATLTIEPGTHVRAFSDGVLLVTRGSMLMAEGTSFEPITFSSVTDDDFDGLGEWGGVIIQGFATQYGAGGAGPCFGSGTVCNVSGEGGDFVGNFGGNIDDDNSGTLRYVRIAEGGFIAGPNNEINGLTLQGVGHGTTIDFIQVQGNLDDGIEWFGGTVNVTHAVLTSNDDDDIDFDEGYRGNIQWAIVQKNPTADAPQGSNDPRGIEANSSDEDYVPETEAVLANITLIGSDVVNNDDAQEGPQPGMRLRGAVIAGIYNSSIDEFDKGCIRIDDADVNGDDSLIIESDIMLVNVLGDCAGGFYERREADNAVNVQELTLSYSSTLAIQEAAAQLDSAPVINAVNNGSGFVFEQTDYVGAVDPNGEAWWQGWILEGTLGEPEAVEPADFVSCNGDNSICTVTGTIDQDYTFVAGTEWRLDGVVRVGEGNGTVDNDADVAALQAAGATLTIRPGVHVRAFSDGVLLVTRGSRLEAVGSAAAPITFSSVADDNFDGLGEWGGVVIQGFAPQYGPGGAGACFGSGTVCNVRGEGGDFVGNFGGNIDGDDSGTLRYVRIAEGGFIAGPNNEINGLTLQGVGHGTTLEFIQVHGNLDDGIEWFGGTVNLRNAVLTSNDDDDIDFDEGYRGNMQYIIVQKNPTAPAPQGSNDPRGIEANSSDEDYVPETNASLANVLVLGSDVVNNDAAQEGPQPGMRLRGALTTRIYNSAVREFDKGCVRIDDADVNGDDSLIVSSNVALVNVIGDCEGGFYEKRAADTEMNAGLGSVSIDSAYALTGAAASVPSMEFIEVDNGSGFSFDNTDYVGAVEPGTAAQDAWWSGWIIEGSLP